jgi:hypothetical protein
MAQNQNHQIAPLAVPDAESIKLGLTPLMMDETSNPIVVKIAHYKGKRRLSIRFHYWDKQDLLKPTRRGIEVPIQHVNQVRTLIDQVLDQLENAKSEGL